MPAAGAALWGDSGTAGCWFPVRGLEANRTLELLVGSGGLGADSVAPSQVVSAARCPDWDRARRALAALMSARRAESMLQKCCMRQRLLDPQEL